MKSKSFETLTCKQSFCILKVVVWNVDKLVISYTSRHGSDVFVALTLTE